MSWYEKDGVFRDWSGRPYRPTLVVDGFKRRQKQETLQERRERKRAEAEARNGK